ncbi:MAG TPA: ABC-2 family transporter protein [Chthonomonadaceae bacterium]|nr:ABC-2 family transporter protein [Chthonomonadaceae bacterium]
MNTLTRLCRLWALYARMDLHWVTRDTKTFVTWSISDTLLNFGGLLGMMLLAQRFGGIGPWSQAQVLFLLSYSAVCGGVMEMFCGFNVAYISRRIGRGQLDHILAQPQPIWMALATEGFCPFTGSAVILPGVLLMAWAVSRLGLRQGPGWYGALALNIAASTVVALSFQFIWGSLAFWAPRAAEEINSASSRLLRQLRPYPLEGLAPALKGALLGLLPVGFLGWAPCRALLGMDSRPTSIWVTPLAAVGFGLIATAVFRKGLAHYGRTGSQRYLAHGHRT